MRLTKDLCIAVVGASANQEKYGYQVFAHLKEKGYEVYPINPKQPQILDKKAFASLKQMQEQLRKVPDLVVFVTQPTITETVVKECIALGIPRLWFQPGAESDKAIALAEQAGIEVVHHACIMIESSKQEPSVSLT